MKDRIQQIIDYLGMTPSQFADSIGVQRPTLHHVLSGRNNPSLEIIQKIYASFPCINLQWLMSGTGPMLESDKSESPLGSDSGSDNQASLSGGASAYETADLFSSEGSENVKFQPAARRGRKKSSQDTLQTPAVTQQTASQSACSDKKIVGVIVMYSDGTFDKILTD